VKCLAKPGGTVTGISDNATTLSTKRLSLLKELLPKLRQVAMLSNADDLAMSLRYEASAAVAPSIDVTVQPRAQTDGLYLWYRRGKTARST
jgi:putative tryptophan/tyrosine transport system substrate-binding protein